MTQVSLGGYNWAKVSLSETMPDQVVPYLPPILPISISWPFLSVQHFKGAFHLIPVSNTPPCARVVLVLLVVAACDGVRDVYKGRVK